MHKCFDMLFTYVWQDKSGSAAMRTVELGDYLGGYAVQHREVSMNPKLRMYVYMYICVCVCVCVVANISIIFSNIILLKIKIIPRFTLMYVCMFVGCNVVTKKTQISNLYMKYTLMNTTIIILVVLKEHKLLIHRKQLILLSPFTQVNLLEHWE